MLKKQPREPKWQDKIRWEEADKDETEARPVVTVISFFHPLYTNLRIVTTLR